MKMAKQKEFQLRHLTWDFLFVEPAFGERDIVVTTLVQCAFMRPSGLVRTTSNKIVWHSCLSGGEKCHLKHLFRLV